MGREENLRGKARATHFMVHCTKGPRKLMRTLFCQPSFPKTHKVPNTPYTICSELGYNNPSPSGSSYPWPWRKHGFPFVKIHFRFPAGDDGRRGVLRNLVFGAQWGYKSPGQTGLPGGWGPPSTDCITLHFFFNLPSPNFVWPGHQCVIAHQFLALYFG